MKVANYSSWLSSLLVVALSLVSAPSAMARPQPRPIPPLDELLVKRANLLDPEEYALKSNGPLPSGMMNKTGYAMECTKYPKAVSRALTGTYARASSNVRNATVSEVDVLEYYATLCMNVYCPAVITQDIWDCPYCDKTANLDIMETFNTKKKDTNVLVARGHKEKTIFIAFRGSQSFKNAIADITFFPVNYPPVKGAKVHKGFLASYNDVAKELIDAVERLADNHTDYAIHVTGHSLGGATAMLCALDLYQRGYNPSLYTFGQPRVGNAKFAQYAVSTKIPYERTVNKRDLVPHLPPAALGFRHAGEEFWITEDNSVVVCPNGIEIDQCSNSIVPFTSMSDHGDYFNLNAEC